MLGCGKFGHACGPDRKATYAEQVPSSHLIRSVGINHAKNKICSQVLLYSYLSDFLLLYLDIFLYKTSRYFAKEKWKAVVLRLFQRS